MLGLFTWSMYLFEVTGNTFFEIYDYFTAPQTFTKKRKRTQRRSFFRRLKQKLGIEQQRKSIRIKEVPFDETNLLSEISSAPFHSQHLVEEGDANPSFASTPFHPTTLSPISYREADSPYVPHKARKIQQQEPPMPNTASNAQEEEKVKVLELELGKLREQIAKIMSTSTNMTTVNVEDLPPPPPPITAMFYDPKVSAQYQQFSLPPPPPPPHVVQPVLPSEITVQTTSTSGVIAPPPPPPVMNVNERTPVHTPVRGNKGSPFVPLNDNENESKKKLNRQSSISLNDLIKGSSSLRKVEVKRSPGGTPVRQTDSPTANRIPATSQELIAFALQKKLQSVRRCNSSPESSPDNWEVKKRNMTVMSSPSTPNAEAWYDEQDNYAYCIKSPSSSQFVDKENQPNNLF